MLNALVLGRGSWRGQWRPIVAGALLPDLPMLAFYLYQRGVLGRPEAYIWSDAYFQADWQLLFDLFNSLPLLAVAALVASRLRALGALAFFLSMIVHCLADLPLHHDDAHAHFVPISSWRFQSPVSYWDPQHHGRFLALAELAFVVAGSGFLVLRSPLPAWRVVGAATLAAYAIFVAFALLVWL